jgi:hypothetical protein
MIAAIAIEGVLAAGPDLRTAPPTKWCRPFYEGLAQNFRTVAFSSADPDVASWWLKREGLTGWAAVMSQEAHITEYSEWKVRQIEEFLAEGWEVGLLLDVDNAVIERVTELGVLTLKVSYPAIKVGWRQHEASPRPWADVSGTL